MSLSLSNEDLRGSVDVQARQVHDEEDPLRPVLLRDGFRPGKRHTRRCGATSRSCEREVRTRLPESPHAVHARRIGEPGLYVRKFATRW